MPSYNMSGEKKIAPRDLMPEGENLLRVVDVEEKTSAKGAEMLVWTLMNNGGLCDTIYTICTEGKRWSLKELLSACGVPVADGEIYNFELSDLKGKTIIGVNRHITEPYTNRNNETVEQVKNKFVRFMPHGNDIPF